MVSEKTTGGTIASAAVFVALELLSVILLMCTSVVFRTRLGVTASGIQAGVSSVVRDAGEYLSLKEENEALSRSNNALLGEVLELCARDSSATLSRGNFSLIEAKVVKLSANKQHNYFIIDKGSEDGVCVDDGVITADGAVGIVEAVGERFSRVRSILNKEMLVSARLRSDGPVGALSWRGKGAMDAVLDEIPLNSSISVADTVYTSGYSAIFPSDIPLGKVTGHKMVLGRSEQVQVRLFTDPSTIRFVSVCHNRDKLQIEAVCEEEDLQ